MKILFLAIGNKLVASSRVRVYSYLPLLRKEGFKVFAMHYTPSWQCKKILAAKRQGVAVKLTAKIYSAAVLLVLFVLAPFFDIVFIQKVAMSKVTISALRLLNKGIVFDFDDAVFFYQDISHLLKKARCVIVSNKYLAEFSRRYNKQTYELPSPVETTGSFIHKDNNHIIIGWVGSQKTSRYLRPLVPIFKALKDRFKNLTIELMGFEEDMTFQPQLDVKTARWSIDGSRRHFEKVHIGVMPLTDDEYSKGKAGYKLLQYMSFGIPCVASPVGVNREIIKNGVNGFLAATEEDWQDKLSLLIEDNVLRQRMGEEGRRLVKRIYSYKAVVPRLIEVLGEVNAG